MLMSSVASQISAEELTAVANNVQSITVLSLESYIVVAILYLILAMLLRVLFWLGGLWLFRRKRVIAAADRRVAMKPSASAITPSEHRHGLFHADPDGIPAQGLGVDHYTVADFLRPGLRGRLRRTFRKR